MMAPSPNRDATCAQVPALYLGSLKPGWASYPVSHMLQPALSRHAPVAGHELRVKRVLCANPGAGGTQRLPRIVGRTAAKELIFTGRRINGTDALRLGLVDHLAAEDQSAEDRALQLARDIAQVACMCRAAVRQSAFKFGDGQRGMAGLACRVRPLR